MPIRKTIGLSVVCLVTSACAVTKTPQNAASHYPGEAARTIPVNSQPPTIRPRSFACGAIQESGPSDFGFDRVEARSWSFEPAIAACDGGGTGSCCTPTRGAGRSQYGKAAWYDLVGNKTASGEALDAVTATAAHRSLPLASFARVIDLDNGRAVIVKINDRGPYTRGRIIDLSPRAAEVLDMKSTGVANVVIEPLGNQPAPLVAAVQNFAIATR